MSEEHHDVDEVTRQIEGELQRWANNHIVGEKPLNEDTLAEFEHAAEMMINELLREVGMDDWEGQVLAARIDPEQDAIVTAGIRIRRRGAD